MNIVIFGLSITSSWGNGHATLWRGLLKALARRGHRLTFFEKDVPWYASHRDLIELPGVELVLYPSWEEIFPSAGKRVADADVAMVTSYCPDSRAASDLVSASRAMRVFYDLDAPVTLHRLRAGEKVDYVPERGYADFDLVMSYTGGRAIEALRDQLGARRVAPIYGSVDPDVHHPAGPVDRWRGDLSYLGTWAADRQGAVDRLLVEPARQRPEMRFVMGGAMYDNTFPWTTNIFFNPHVPPADHPAFYCSSRATLNVTRAAMAEYGYCPSGRLFEAAACGAPLITDVWDGLDSFFQPGDEIVTAESAQDVLDALDRSAGGLERMARRARERALDEHTADRRAIDFEDALVMSVVA
jgi:spore maturation protein CgeB